MFVSILDSLEVAKKIKEGAVVTIKHLGKNVHGTVQSPKFFRERIDVKWEDVINN